MQEMIFSLWGSAPRCLVTAAPKAVCFGVLCFKQEEKISVLTGLFAFCGLMVVHSCLRHGCAFHSSPWKGSLSFLLGNSHCYWNETFFMGGVSTKLIWSGSLTVFSSGKYTKYLGRWVKRKKANSALESSEKQSSFYSWHSNGCCRRAKGQKEKASRKWLYNTILHVLSKKIALYIASNVLKHDFLFHSPWSTPFPMQEPTHHKLLLNEPSWT